MVTNEQIIEAATNATLNNKSMLSAAKEVGMSMCGFKQRAKQLGVYAPTKLFIESNGITPLNKYPVPTVKLKKVEGVRKRLIQEVGLICERCGLTEWQGSTDVIFQMHHIDGDRKNNERSNLQLLCPNCHSITINYGHKSDKYKNRHI